MLIVFFSTNAWCMSQVVTVTFQQGVDGYFGTVDTYLDEDEPNMAPFSFSREHDPNPLRTPVHTL